MNKYSIEKLPSDVLRELAERFRAARKRANLTQTTLAERSGISLGSIKRFEATGQVSLESLLKLSLVVGRLPDFDGLFQTQGEDYHMIERLFDKA
jgi:transcriptional regulator with XRE-family HTH domain